MVGNENSSTTANGVPSTSMNTMQKQKARMQTTRGDEMLRSKAKKTALTQTGKAPSSALLAPHPTTSGRKATDECMGIRTVAKLRPARPIVINQDSTVTDAVKLMVAHRSVLLSPSLFVLFLFLSQTMLERQRADKVSLDYDIKNESDVM